MRNNKFLYKLKNEYIGRAYATFCGILIVVVTLSIMFFVLYRGIQTFSSSGIKLSEILSTNWNIEGDDKSYGLLIFVIGSTLVSIGAVIVATPIAITLSIFINIVSKSFGKKVIKPALEMFVGIPSVVYGLLGIMFLVPFIKEHFGGIGFSLLSGIIVLSIMILPTIAALSSDAIARIPNSYIEASYGLGSTRWQTISRVIIPAASKGILTAVVLGFARAFGEALAVQMVIGNTIKLPNSLISPTSTMTGLLTMNMANAIQGTEVYNVLWTLAAILLIISFVFILIMRAIGNRGEK